MRKPLKTIPLLPQFKDFISKTRKGKRLTKDGRQLSLSSIENYESVYKLLLKYEEFTGQIIEIPVISSTTQRLFITAKNYWEKFYKNFSAWLYQRGYIDNYVGFQFKTLRTFFNYLYNEKHLNIGQFYKNFYVRKEEIPVIVLNQDQLNLLLVDENFYKGLPEHLKVTRDILVFGCTVGLRYSDLIDLTIRNIEKTSGAIYIIKESKKTEISTRIKLPPYAFDILHLYWKKQKGLFPVISKAQFNKNIKSLGELAGWTWEVGKERRRNSQKKLIKTPNGSNYRFCDLLSSHIMRKTAITTLLMNGVPEHMVRKISGHTSGSKEFFRYVKYSQSFVDVETDKAFEKLVNNRVAMDNNITLTKAVS